MNRVHEPKLKGKSYDIPKRLLWDAWQKVKENGGAAGADGVTIEQFEEASRGTSTGCGIGCRRGRTSLGRSGQWRYPRRAASKGREYSASLTSQTGSPKRRRQWRWSPAWSRSSTRTPTATVPGGRPCRRWRYAGSGASRRTGLSISTSRPSWCHRHTASSFMRVVSKRVHLACGTSIRRPFWRPLRTWMASSSPRFTRCNTVWRLTPRIRIASSIGT